jgi:Holin of 3TMs, for gene-transfer release
MYGKYHIGDFQMADEEIKLSASEKKKEDWMNSKWRPMMGWMYMLICTMDMVVFPILWSLLQSISHGAVNSQWQPLTLQGAGLFHIAMGAVLGIAAHGRTQEKLNGANNGGLGGGTTYVPPAPVTGGFGNGNTTTGFSGGATTPGVPSTGFGAPSGSFGSAPTPTTVPSWGTTPIATAPAVVTGFGGKPAPAPAAQPLL